MQLKPEQLPGHLEQKLLPVYLVSGDEPLLQQECCDQIRLRARAGGCSEREIIDASPRDFNWQELLDCAGSMSLFAERKLIELRLPSGKPGAEGSKALCAYLEMGSEDILLISAGRIDKQSTNSKWYKALERAGAAVTVWPVGERELPRWLRQRLKAAGMSADEDALALLCDRLEGNLLAAVQEVEKLKLLAADGRVSAATVQAAVADSARYNVFALAEYALQGDLARCLRMLHGLRGEGNEPLALLGMLLRDIRILLAARQAADQGQNPLQVLQQQRVWQSRMPLMQAALGRHDTATLASLLELALAVDGSVKGFAPGDPWDNLEALLAALCGDTGTLH